MSGAASDSQRPETLASCPGVPSHLKPWKPHALCVGCTRRTHIGTSVIQPAIERKAGQWVCENRPAESCGAALQMSSKPGEAEQPLVVVVGGTVNTPGTKAKAATARTVRPSVTESKGSANDE